LIDFGLTRLGPGQPGQRLPQRRLVALHGEQMAGAATVQVLGMRPLTVQGVGSDQDIVPIRQGVE
jgi:hypothetical protein